MLDALVCVKYLARLILFDLSILTALDKM